MNSKRIYWIGFGLFLATAFLYAPALLCGFVNYDDPVYVTNNPHVFTGLTGANLAWSFQAGYGSNWHPLTWIAHMLDCQVFGLRPAGHHAINAILHSLNTALLFLLFHRLTGAVWRSAMVAALFACHPMHVESVAWISERKDVLSAFFFLLTLLAYTKWVRKKTLRSYWIALLFFALGLMAKPMLVTLPFILLLLDFWPLGRAGVRVESETKRGSAPSPLSLPRLLLEKTPFLTLAVASCVITIIAQRRGGALLSLEAAPIKYRIINALVSYFNYFEKLVWPENLSVIYPPHNGWASWEIVTAAAFLIAFSAVAVWQAKKKPYWLVGWLWFLGTLVPVIGLVQVGQQAMADRYAYIPSVGLFIILCWAVSDLAGSWPRGKPLIAGISVVILTYFSLVTGRQLLVWQNSGSLYLHSLAVTKDNDVAHANYGAYLRNFNQITQARAELEEAVRLAPRFVWAQSLLGKILMLQRNYDEAAARLSEALRLDPNLPEAHYALALIFSSKQNKLEAKAHYREAIRLRPEYPEPLNDLAWLLASDPRAENRDGAEAVKLASLACALTDFKIPTMIGTLAAAYAEAGRFPEAIAAAEKARDTALSQGNNDLAAKNSELLKLYQSSQAYHEP